MKFLLVRFAPGAAGKMLITCLGTHPEIASWNTTNKSDLAWAKECYTGNFDAWLDSEPQTPWQIKKFISAIYPRGDDLESIPIKFPNLWIPIVWQKNYPAKFMKTYQVVNILLDKTSMRWYHKSRWRKQFSIDQVDDKVVVTQHRHRPTYQVGNFNNVYKLEVTNLRKFIKDNVINYYVKHQFLRVEDQIAGTNIFLSELLNEQGLEKSLRRIGNDLRLKEFNWEEAKLIWQYWKKLHNY